MPLRRHVDVTGQLQEIHGLITLVPAGPDNVKMEGRGRPVVPVSVDTDGVNEATEGLLVVVEGVITQAVMNDLPYGLKFYVDDGSGEIQVFISASTGIGLGGLALGQHVRVTDNTVVETAEIVGNALDWYEQGADFADALHLAAAGTAVMHTFDREFCKAAREVGVAPEVRVWVV